MNSKIVCNKIYMWGVLFLYYSFAQWLPEKIVRYSKLFCYWWKSFQINKGVERVINLIMGIAPFICRG